MSQFVPKPFDKLRAGPSTLGKHRLGVTARPAMVSENVAIRPKTLPRLEPPVGRGLRPRIPKTAHFVPKLLARSERSIGSRRGAGIPKNVAIRPETPSTGSGRAPSRSGAPLGSGGLAGVF